MWLLMVYITVWALSPGPVAILTTQKTRSEGFAQGSSVVMGASVTSILMVIVAVAIEMAGLSSLVEKNSVGEVETIGAIGIISVGAYLLYQSLSHDAQESNKTETDDIQSDSSFAQGFLMMATYFPQALVFYNLMVPQAVTSGLALQTIIMLGTLKVALIFFWHLAIAAFVSRTTNWVSSRQLDKALEIVSAFIIVGIGVNVLI